MKAQHSPKYQSKPMPLKVKFIGAVGAVTGSCHLLHYDRSNSYYMIDCGFYQGVRGHKDMNKARGEATWITAGSFRVCTS
jgi:hypothetical protein